MSEAIASAFGGVGEGRHDDEPGPLLEAVSRPHRKRSSAASVDPIAGPNERIVRVGDRSLRSG